MAQFHRVRWREFLGNSPKLTSLRFSTSFRHQNSSSAWPAKTKHRLMTFQPTVGAVPAHSATLLAQPRTHASPFRASARTALRPSIEETQVAVHREAEGPFPPRANRQTFGPSQRHKSSQTSSTARLRASQRLPPQRPQPPRAELVSIFS